MSGLGHELWITYLWHFVISRIASRHWAGIKKQNSTAPTVTLHFFVVVMCSNYDGERLTLLHTKTGTSHKFRAAFVFLRKDEVITLQLFVWLSLFQGAGVSLTGKRSPNSLCFVTPEDSKIMFFFFYSYVNVFWVLCYWYCVKTPLPPPRPRCFSSSLPSVLAHETKQCVVCSWCQINF